MMTIKKVSCSDYKIHGKPLRSYTREVLLKMLCKKLRVMHSVFADRGLSEVMKSQMSVIQEELELRQGMVDDKQ